MWGVGPPSFRFVYDYRKHILTFHCVFVHVGIIMTWCLNCVYPGCRIVVADLFHGLNYCKTSHTEFSHHGCLFSQGILAIIPGMLLVGFAVSPYMLYTGLLLYSFGKCNFTLLACIFAVGLSV